ncbi:MAG: 3-keto-5-aminohexanoate cleavage protein [Burkholderiaceae bacterium]|nr:3-keto-5-aminohexanoate cleavage protein [Burkholderiaceae bacterium]
MRGNLRRGGCEAHVIDRSEICSVHQRVASLDGHWGTGLQDTFYLPDGSKAASNGSLIPLLASNVRREVALSHEARVMLGLKPS